MGSTNGRCKQTLIPTLSMLIIFCFTFRETQGHRFSSPASSLTWRNLLETSNVLSLGTSTQSDCTVRVDPLNHFKKYRGGYNITNVHYWTSTIYTGVAGYAMGALWFFFGIASGAALVATSISFHDKKRANLKQKSCLHDQFYLYSTLSAIFLAILAIVGCGLVLGGNQRFYSEANSVVNIVMETANEASTTIYNTTRAMKDVRNNLEESHANIEASTFLSSTSEKLDVQAADIEQQSKKKRRLIDKGLKILYIIVAVAISLILVAVLALSASGVVKLCRRVTFMFIVICWFLAVLSWILFGMYFFSNIALVCNPFSDPPFFRYQPNNCTANAIKIGDIPGVRKKK